MSPYFTPFFAVLVSATPQMPEECFTCMIKTMDEVIGILLKHSNGIASLKTGLKEARLALEQLYTMNLAVM